METQKVFLLHTKQPEQFSTFASILIEDGWQLVQAIDLKILENYTIKRDGRLYCLGIFNTTNCSFSADELNILSNFCQVGHSMIIAGCENENSNQTNLNSIIAKYSIAFNEDCIIRPNLYKHYHPKEAQLRDFIVNRGFIDTLKKYWKAQEVDDIIAKESGGNLTSGPHLLYPYGCSLKVGKTSTIMMTSSQWAIPCRQAICAFYGNTIRGNNTRVIVVGSARMISDLYIDKEDNKAIIRTLIEYIVNKSSPINVSDAKTVEIPDVIHGPDVEALLDVPISCIQESEQLPSDKMSLINKKLYNIDSSKLPAIVRAYQDLNVEHKPLTLIKPELDFESPKLEPATHGFLVRRSIRDK